MDVACEHRWHYYVDTCTRAIRSKRCELCDLRLSVGAGVEAPTVAPVRAA